MSSRTRVFSLAVILCLSTGSSGQFVPDVMPPGEPSALVLFDFHTKASDNGTCTDFRPRAMEMFLAIQWLRNTMAGNNTESGVCMICDKAPFIRQTSF